MVPGPRRKRQSGAMGAAVNRIDRIDHRRAYGGALPETRLRSRNPGQAAGQASGRTPTHGLTPETPRAQIESETIYQNGSVIEAKGAFRQNGPRCVSIDRGTAARLPSRKAVSSRGYAAQDAQYLQPARMGVTGSRVGRLPQRRMKALYTTLDFMFTNAQAYR
jgi:hypothetical protein